MEAAAVAGVSPDIDLITELNRAFHGTVDSERRLSGRVAGFGPGSAGEAGWLGDMHPTAVVLAGDAYAD
jgi:hypothetical protein